MGGRPPIPIESHKLDKEKLYGDLALREQGEPRSTLEPKMPRNLTKDQKKFWKFYPGILKINCPFYIGNGRPGKTKATEKIDGLVVLIVAWNKEIFGRDETSVYET
jgi:hypothetical protein